DRTGPTRAAASLRAGTCDRAVRHARSQSSPPGRVGSSGAGRAGCGSLRATGGRHGQGSRAGEAGRRAAWQGLPFNLRLPESRRQAPSGPTGTGQAGQRLAPRNITDSAASPLPRASGTGYLVSVDGGGRVRPAWLAPTAEPLVTLHHDE